MQARVFPPLVEAFLILEQPRQRLVHWSTALAPLDDDRAPPLATVSAYYDPTCDQALLGLRYDELALGRERLSFVIEIALLAEIGMIQPSELSEGDRRRFLGERLARCTVNVTDQRNVVNALAELVRRVRERVHRPGVPPPIPLTKPRASTSDPVLSVQPKSTRDDLDRMRREQMPLLARATRDGEMITEPMPLVPPAPERPKPRTLSPHIIQRAPSPRPRSVTPDGGTMPRADRVHRAPTVQMDPADAKKLAGSAATSTAAVTTIRAPGARVTADLPVAPAIARTETPGSAAALAAYLDDSSIAPSPGVIYARYLRSGRWVPIRIGALSLRGAALMAGALPRLREHVDLSLSFANHRALVRGPVHKVTSREEATLSGAASFSVTFELDDTSRRQLTQLLTAARAANVTIKPPPARGTRRYPVEWPVCLGTSRGAIRAEALDLSREGMFVRPANALALDTNLSFSAVLDFGAAAVSGRARVARHISEIDARTSGLSPGYGLQITEMTDPDRARWEGFLSRIELRAERRVLVGASPGRLLELQAALAAAGYAVTGATDPEALVQVAGQEGPHIDACLIDGAWLPPIATATWAESLFPDRDVPCVMMRGDVRRARSAIDQALMIV